MSEAKVLFRFRASAGKIGLIVVIMKESSGHSFRIYTRAVIFDETKKRVLLIKKNANQKIGSGEWLFPGGTVEFGEDIETALIREVQEETGLRINSLRLLTTKKMIIDNIHWVGIYYSGEVSNESDVENLEPSKHEMVEFVSLEKIPDFQDYTILEKVVG
ncbi:MAG: hypothetical protein CO075_02600 [Candidatus Moranbacteria bacterium CG_4_9_14_0_8_um_filter_41_43]|nr:MAG: hypothetical protein COX32_04430 [Candidatus Moranbacteria bacterium CG23_combo_of_CG06-09_8_20_14_all_41_28]PIV86588.1 MAG: hypothetical protein COW50_00715 [Candidatus Moranbacteria bacterium CG17_big_fil_post_rev_8_21_14_2_50_41_107]PJC00087.1 MAG: hypothetical protein CO075_02600 [Candidatus Moranbacteria bacterium CG_4_9_14_0_8_um_filter_41_43]